MSLPIRIAKKHRSRVAADAARTLAPSLDHLHLDPAGKPPAAPMNAAAVAELAAAKEALKEKMKGDWEWDDKFQADDERREKERKEEEKKERRAAEAAWAGAAVAADDDDDPTAPHITKGTVGEKKRVGWSNKGTAGVQGIPKRYYKKQLGQECRIAKKGQGYFPGRGTLNTHIVFK